ncbi:MULTISPECIES: SusC/RagA family TonB-linked outer membrane protein [unclassified Proteiniphilum]|jgi:TonB-linked SusC/RagA family outer membrane protein|uniref:SusC/RagA family TonB-linked outer membrane protein n=1 Tax=unclassified Proteiniphilum TaxID=2622718 RepID=UPI00257E81F9|nr:MULTISPECIES: TonB-dependent receptor [unclassified Proteiniphilum]
MKKSKLIIFMVLSAFMQLKAHQAPMNEISISLNALSSQQQSSKVEIKGMVIDINNEPMIGVNVFYTSKEGGIQAGTSTDMDGNYVLQVERDAEVTFRLIGYKTSTIRFTGNNENAFRVVTMFEDSELLDEVQIVAFGRQKKESVVSSISTIKPAELKIPSSNLTNSLAGRISGLVSYQRSGEPGADNAEFFVRGVTSFGYSKSPLILIDGLELTTEDLARLNTDDIESFSILKDATSAALYGSRAANGVIMVTTKQGSEGKARVSFRVEGSLSSPVSKVKTVDPISYMELFNEAISTRNPLERARYSQMQIDNTKAGLNKNVYPATDWYNLLFADQTWNQRYNMNINGGGKVAQYYIAANYSHDNGNLKVDKRNNFNQNISINRVNVRSNITINMAPTTKVAIRMNGSFDDYKGPVHDGTKVYSMIMKTSPVDYPAYFDADADHKYTNHILFGNNNQANALNPYAELVKGYRNYSRTFLSMQAELNQKLDLITKGLNFRLSVNTNRTGFYESSRQYNPYYYYVDSYDRIKDEYVLFNSNEQTGTEYLNYTKGNEYSLSVVYLETALNYARAFNDKHDVSGLMVFTMRDESRSAASSLSQSLPYRNLGLAGRATYGYDSRYFIEANFGYNASERFHKSHRWGFFPSVGFGWILTNEEFMKNVNNNVLSLLKFKGTYGKVGNERIGDVNDRFFYLSNVNLSATTGPGFGLNMNRPIHRPTTSIIRYANNNIGWEVANKLDLGFELELFNDFVIIADYFREDRSNILQSRASITDEIGVEFPDNVKANIGKAFSQGFDGSIDYNKSFNKDLWLQGRVNFTYAKGKFNLYEEPEYADAPWLSHIDQPITQQWGYVAERLFVDENDVKNSPSQFGDYKAGDIKYKDINGDGVINFKDRVPIGYPTTPEIIYGFGLSLGYKNFDLSAFFQGSGRSSFWIDQGATAPFVASSMDNRIGNNTMLKAYADDYWSESNQNIYALWPRLSSYVIENNNQTSTWFMQDGSFLRLKSVEIGYTISKKIQRKLLIDNFRIYVDGSNLLTLSKFKLWDPEMAGNGLGYPIQRVINFGLQIGF